MLVREWMTREVNTIQADAPAQDAWDAIVSEEIRQLPVLDGEKLVGVVSRGDLLRAVRDMDGALSDLEVPVSEVMTSDPITIEPFLPFEEAASLMDESRVGSLIVVDEGELIGILTRTDLFRAIMEITGLKGSVKREEYADSHLGKCFTQLRQRPDGKFAKSFLAYRDDEEKSWNCMIRFAEQADS